MISLGSPPLRLIRATPLQKNIVVPAQGLRVLIVLFVFSFLSFLVSKA